MGPMFGDPVCGRSVWCSLIVDVALEGTVQGAEGEQDEKDRIPCP